MSSIDQRQTVGEIVAHNPHLARVFEGAGIDYCCAGKTTLRDACEDKGLDPADFAARLARAESEADGPPEVDSAAMSLAELADHIEATHHAYLRSELPRLDGLSERVASAHGRRDPRLYEVRNTLLSLAAELSHHMVKEERILFPLVRELEAAAATPDFPCGSLANPIRQMEHEHDDAGAALDRLRELTDGYTPPEWACNTYRALLDSLARLEQDLHRHIHKENNVLFPRAQEMEGAKAAR